jgi:two-component system response regulator AtoC
VLAPAESRARRRTRPEHSHRLSRIGDPDPTYEVLIIDDDPLAAQLASDVLESRPFNVFGAANSELALEWIAKRRPALVLLDQISHELPGLEMLDRILAIDPGIDVILVASQYSTESAIEAIQRGAYDYLPKPVPVDRLREKLAKWLAETQERRRTSKLDHELLDAFRFENMVGRSPLMLEVFSRIRRIAPHFNTVLLTGETGTGKELAAKALHHLSPFSGGPFIECNCAAISDSLFESELFGHTRGAFTHATQDKQGFVEAAAGGTLFLDEIAEIPLHVQPKLLRLLQNREVQRIGMSRPKQVDVRIVAATNRKLRNMVSENKLREDLYYRLATIEVKLPRLADRREDLPLLQRYFLDQFSQRYGKPQLNLTRRAQAMIAGYSWPGNVRELENVLGYCAMMTTADTIDAQDVAECLDARGPEAEDRELVSLDEIQRQHVFHVFGRVGGNRVRAAAILGISRATLYRLLARTPSP